MKYLLMSLVFLPLTVVAQGDQNQNPIFEDDCVTITPPGINPENCEMSAAPSQSGIQVYFCGSEIVVLCPPEDDDD